MLNPVYVNSGSRAFVLLLSARFSYLLLLLIKRAACCLIESHMLNQDAVLVSAARLCELRGTPSSRLTKQIRNPLIAFHSSLNPQIRNQAAHFVYAVFSA